MPMISHSYQITGRPTGRAWAAICLFNLLIVAGLGLLMRLNILFSLPWIDQRFTLHAHSHFAFSGWVSQALMLNVALVVTGKGFAEKLSPRYGRLLAFNLFCSYGMLVSFFIQGYGVVSIFFSTLSVLVSFIFYAFCRRDVAAGQRKQLWWKYINLALVFGMLSTCGTFSLAYTMVSQPANIELRLASVYFYLHFQYNGWFFFACMGLLHHWLANRSIILPAGKTTLALLAVCAVLTYLLSINWMPFPGYLHAFTGLTAVVQLCAWGLFMAGVRNVRRRIGSEVSGTARLLLSAVLLAASIKFILQTASSVPYIATLAFGFRPLVIAYLHLVLLGMISLFLISWFCQHQAVSLGTFGYKGLWIFVSGVILNEVFLMVQGISALSGIYIPAMPEALAIAGLMAFSGICLVVKSISPSPFRPHWPAVSRHGQ